MERRETFTMSSDLGPLLQETLNAEARASAAVRYPSIEWTAQAIAGLASRLANPILWPVGDEGQRLVGAVELVGNGRFDALTWGTDVTGRVVLLVAPVGVSSLGIATTVDYAWRLGACEVHGCALDTVIGTAAGLTTFTLLEKPSRWVRQRKKSA
jgi:hypothetical protein